MIQSCASFFIFKIYSFRCARSSLQHAGPLLHHVGFFCCSTRIPWRRKWQPTPVFLPREGHGQRSLVGYSHRVTKSQTRLSDSLSLSLSHTHTHTHTQTLQLWHTGSGPRGLSSPRHKAKFAQSCPTLCDPTDYTVHGTLQARILEWVAFPFSRGSSQPRIELRSPALQADSLPAEPPGKL